MIAARLRWSLARPARTRLASSLREVNRSFEELTRSTEQDFLLVGGRLQEIVTRARTEAETLASLGGDLSGERRQALAESLDQVLAWAGQARQESDGTELFQELGGALAAVRTHLRDLKSMVRSLRVMGVVAAIESARLGERAAGFAALAGEVGGLASAIDEKAEAMLETAGALCGQLRRTRTRAGQLEQVQASDLLRTVTRCSRGLEVLRAEQERTEGVARQAQAEYKQVQAVIGEVVQSLQSHDATRQRIEHVELELEQLATRLDASKGGGAGVSPQIVELLATQLGEAARSFLDCVGDIRANLSRLAGTVRALARMARELLGRASDTGQSLTGEVEAHYSAVGSAIAEWTSARRALAGAASSVGEACARMSVHNAEIESVGVRMLWLALNAEVQAVQLAGSGAVMEAVAEGIRGVAQQASANAAAVSLALREVESRAQRLAAVLGGNGQSSVEGADILTARIRELEANLRARGVESSRLLEAIAAGSEVLAAEISTLSEGITAHEAMSSVSSRCLRSLEQIAACPILATADRGANLHGLRDRYTMHAEREVHDSFARTAAPAEDSPIAPPATGSEYGDNVELF